jgi:hypothetical protein
MSKLDQLRAQREAWAEGKPKLVTYAQVDAALAVTLNPPIKSNAGIKSNRTGPVAAGPAPVAQAAATAAPGSQSKRGRPAKPDGVTKDRAAYMRARRAKKP